MLSENLRLHEALAKLDANDERVQAALAATQANWHASRKAWPEAVAAFDRLVAADPTAPEAWLRTPGLLRLATALLHQNRPPSRPRCCKEAPNAAPRMGSPGRCIDGVTSRCDCQSERSGDRRILHPLRAAVNERLAKEPRDAGLLELRAELAGQWSDAKAQVADYTAAIDVLAQQKPEATAADLKRLYGRRGNAYVALQQWQQAVDDYARVVTDATTDVDLLSNRARAYEALKNWDAAAADWSRAATGNPEGPELLAEFARRACRRRPVFDGEGSVRKVPGTLRTIAGGGP